MLLVATTVCGVLKQRVYRGPGHTADYGGSLLFSTGESFTFPFDLLAQATMLRLEAVQQVLCAAASALLLPADIGKIIANAMDQAKKSPKPALDESVVRQICTIIQSKGLTHHSDIQAEVKSSGSLDWEEALRELVKRKYVSRDKNWKYIVTQRGRMYVDRNL